MNVNLANNWYEIVTVGVSLASFLATASIALLVFRFTKISSRLAMERSVADGWARYSELLCDHERLSEFSSFLMEESELGKTLRPVHQTVFLFLNNVQYQWRGVKVGLIKGETVDEIETMLQILQPRSDYVLRLMRRNGYSQEYIQFVEDALDRDAAQ